MKFKKKKSLPVWVYIICAVVPIVLVVGTMVYSVVFTLEYREYCQDFAGSINYANANGGIIAELNGVTTIVKGHNVEAIYKEIMAGDIAYYVRKVPDEDCLLLDFGNGDIMRIWEKDKTTLIIQYIAADGDKVLYETFETTRFVSVERLVSEAWGNKLLGSE